MTSQKTHHEPHVEAELRQMIQSIKSHLDELEGLMLSTNNVQDPETRLKEFLESLDRALTMMIIQLRLLR